MADDKNLDPKKAEEVKKETAAAVSQIERFSKEAERANQALVGIAGMMRKTASASVDFGAELKGAGNLTKQVASQAEALSKFTKEDLKDKTKTSAILKKQKLVKGQIQAIESKIAVLNEKAANATESESKLIFKIVEGLNSAAVEAESVLGTFQEIEDINDDLNSKTSWIESIAEVAGDIPVIGKFFKEFDSAAKEARKAGAEGGSALTAGMGAVGKAAGKMALAFSGAIFTKGIFKTNQDITDLSRNLNISREAATGLDKKFRDAGISIKGLSGDNLREATMAVSNQLGISADLSIETAAAAGTMVKKFGLSAEQAANLTTFTAATGKNLKQFNDNLIGTVTLQNAANGTAIRYQDVMKDISEASAATTLSTSKMPGGLARAAVEARKLGLSFSKMEGIADSLLDYESSIANEMEAELLTGQQLNLDGARQAALRNDLVGMSQELAKNGITQAKFSSMNRIQQTAIAKAMGMSREEMEESLIKQEAIKNLSFDTSKSLDENIKKEMEAIKTLREQGKIKEANARQQKLQNELGETETYRQLENKSAAEAQKEAMQDMTAAVGDLARVLQPVTAMFSSISTVAGETFVFITKMGSKMKALGVVMMDAFKPLSQLKTIPETAMKLFGRLGKFLGGSFIKAGAKGGFKSLLKKIPVLGALVGLGFAAKRFANGDYLGAGMEFLSGVASIFPGIGTAVSAGLDVGLMAMDAGGVTGNKSTKAKNSRSTSPSANNTSDDGIYMDDFTIHANPKDTITMAGGTKLGGNVEALLETLIMEVRKGGTINMDGYKVGEVMGLSARVGLE